MKDIAKTGALVALTVLLAVTAGAVVDMHKHGAAWAQAQIQREADATRAAALTAIADTRKDVLAEVAATRKDLLAELVTTRKELMAEAGTIRTDVLTRVDDARQLVDTRLVDLTGKLDAQVTGMRADVQPLVKSTGRVLDAAAEQAELMGMCAEEDPETGALFGNQDCLANRLIPAMKNFEHMAAAGEKVFNAVAAEAAPTATAVREGAQQATGIATDIHTITTDLTATVPWYKKLSSGLYYVLELAARWF